MLRSARQLLYRALLAGCFFCAAVATSPAADLEPARGVYLVAADGLPDPRFQNSVVLLLQHDQRGSVGLVINRQSRLSLADLLPSQPAIAEDGGTLSYGGPVAAGTLLVLLRSGGDEPADAKRIFADVYVTGVEELADRLEERRSVDTYRVFAGYAGWGVGQLAHELARGDWRVLPADAGSLFNDPGVDLWKKLRKMRVM